MSEQADEAKGERIAKRLARAGLCSRRDAERWIEDGRVKVDNARTKGGKIYHHLWDAEEIDTLLKEQGLAKKEGEEGEET